MEKPSRASRESPAPKRRNDNEDLEDQGKFGRFERSRAVSMESAPADDDDFEAHMQDIDGMELVDRKIIAATMLGVDITEV